MVNPTRIRRWCLCRWRAQAQLCEPYWKTGRRRRGAPLRCALLERQPGRGSLSWLNGHTALGRAGGLGKWVEASFPKRFTHAGNVKITSHPEGHSGSGVTGRTEAFRRSG